jgi:hypothetical protein
LDVKISVYFFQDLGIKNRRVVGMVMIELPSSKSVRLSFIPCELKSKRAISRPLLVPSLALVSRLSLLASIAVKNKHTIAIPIYPLCSLRDKFDVLRSKVLQALVSNLCHIFEEHPSKRGEVFLLNDLLRIVRVTYIH